MQLQDQTMDGTPKQDQSIGCKLKCIPACRSLNHSRLRKKFNLKGFTDKQRCQREIRIKDKSILPFRPIRLVDLSLEVSAGDK